MDKPIEISVIICTYNRDNVFRKTLDLMAQQSDRDFELLIINNNSTDSTTTICEDFTRENPKMLIKYVNESNQGLSYARNRGVQEASGDYLLFLDDDAFAFPNYIKNFRSFIEKYPEAKAGGGKILPHYESDAPRWMSKYLMSLTSTLDMGTKVALFKGRSYPIGANMFMHKSIFEDGFCFNTQLGRKGKNLAGGEEKELFLLIKKQNTPIYYMPEIVVGHWVPDNRLTNEFFTRQALGIGVSEQIRAKSESSFAYFSSCMREILKWGATGILFLGYTLMGSYAKGAKLIEFRWKVSKGLLSNPNLLSQKI